MTTRKLGIMGGSFNPIHIGHLHLAESARVEFGLDRVLFVPSNNPFKAGKMTVSRDARYDMVKLAVASNPAFDASPIEIVHPGKTYTIDTIKLIHDKNPDTELYFITGADIMFEILNWRSAKELLRLTHFITATRPGYPQARWKKCVRNLRRNYHAKIHKLTSSEMDITSTDIRERIRAGKSVKYLVPEPVEAYIRSHHLYEKKQDHHDRKNHKEHKKK